MSTLPQRPAASAGDGLGYHVLGFDKNTGDRLEMLRVRPQFSGHAPFDVALRNRLRQLVGFSNPAFARVRQIDRLAGSGPAASPSTVIVSDHVLGVRLAEVLSVAESFDLRIDIGTALSLVRQLTAAIAALHAYRDEITHGCIGPERLLLMADGRLIVTEYILGSALEAMEWPREKFWYEARIGLPTTGGGEPAIFDRQADIMQIGLLTLALLENRQVYTERRYPLPLAQHVAAAREVPLEGQPRRISPALTDWLARALQRDRLSAFTTLDEMLTALDRVIDNGRYDARPSTVAAFITRCREASPELKPREVVPPRSTLAPAMIDSGVPVHVDTRAHVPVHNPTEFVPIELMPVIGDDPVVFESADARPAALAQSPSQGHVLASVALEEASDEASVEEMNSLLDMEVFVGMVHQQKRPFVVQVNRLPLLLVEPVRRSYWLLPTPPAGTEAPPIGEVVARLRRGSLRYRDARADDPPPDAGFPIELLLWNLGMVLQPDDLLPQVTTRGWVQLTRWPDFGRIRSNPAQLKMSALLTNRAFQVDEVFEALGEPRPQVIAFVNACALCGLLADAPVEATAPSIAHVASEGRSLGGLMQRLRGALGIGLGRA